METVKKKRKKRISNKQAWNNLDKLLRDGGIYCGIPLGWGDDGFETVGNTHDPKLSVVLDRNEAKSEPYESVYGLTIRNTWKLKRPINGNYARIFIFEKDGKIDWLPAVEKPPEGQRLNMWLESGARRVNATFMSAERTARKKLKSMLTRCQWESYDLEGSFVEKSPRSKLLYMVRRGRPTIPLRIQDDESVFPLCALCLHPLGYYEGTWAGALAPSDEVISHLLYIRGDEYAFWKRANHIPIDDPRSGV